MRKVTIMIIINLKQSVRFIPQCQGTQGLVFRKG